MPSTVAADRRRERCLGAQARALLRACLAAAAIAVPAACGAETQNAVIINAEQSGRSVSLTVGQTLLVRLIDLTGAGYGWSVAKNDAAILRPEPPQFESDPDPGKRGMHVYPFKALAPGRVELVFHSSRPWERDKPPERVVTFSVTVTKAQ